MKTTTNSTFKMILSVLAAAFVFAGTSSLWAHDGQWDGRHHYYRDNYGYWDNGDHYRHYEHWHNHTGYWDTRGGSHIFINVE
jgi:hypothetical protein